MDQNQLIGETLQGTNIQRLVSLIAMALVFCGLSGLIGYQVVIGHPLDNVVIGAWGTMLGQYIKILGVDTGVTSAVRVLVSSNGVKNGQTS